MAIDDSCFVEALEILRRNAGQADGTPAWPDESWRALRQAGVLRWCIPTAYGGDCLEGTDLLQGYEQLAASCLTSCFILSQRDAACRRLRDGANETLRRELLPLLAKGDAFATVGLSQLTTSRQHVQPTFVAHTAGDHFILNGTIPWVTGAAQAQYVVIGAAVEDQRQILAILPTDLPGVSIGPPMELMALLGSLTSEVRCEQVVLERQWLLAGPAQRIMASGRGGTGGLETTCLALGLARSAIDYLHSEATTRPELKTSADRLEHSYQGLTKEMHQLVDASCTAEAAAALRARANTLVLRATQAALTASKGTGFLKQHPAQRWARQALFFLVWSCPRPAADATLASLIPDEAFACP